MTVPLAHPLRKLGRSGIEAREEAAGAPGSCLPRSVSVGAAYVHHQRTPLRELGLIVRRVVWLDSQRRSHDFPEASIAAEWLSELGQTDRDRNSLVADVLRCIK